jgi:HEAT repeat protein
MEGDMKNALLFLVLVVCLAAVGTAQAAKHNSSASGSSMQPELNPAQVIASNDYVERESLETLLLKLEDEDPFVRVEAVQSLGEIYLEKSLVSVCGCLDDDNLYVRAYAAEALGRVGQIDVSLALSQLLPALDDPSPYVRAMMLAALGELQDKRAVESIRKHLADDDESVRSMAQWALNKIESSD